MTRRAAELLASADALASAVRARLAASEAAQRTHAEEVLARYDEVDRRLVRAGFPATSSWWLETFRRWYGSGRRQAVIRAGRRAGKSSSLSRLAVVEALYGRHVVPPGDLGTVAIIAQNRVEGAKRLRTVTAVLDALGVAYAPLGGSAVGVELVGRRIAVQVFAASIAGVSGFTGVFVLCDEVSKWLDDDTGANPATEVLASVRPTMATQPNARIVLSSSPMSTLDAHYDAFEAGETAFQVVAYAPTWEANPTVTEADTRALEPDEAKWRREYLAVPTAEAESSLLSAMLIDRARRMPPLPADLPWREGWRYVAAMDPATRGNAWTLVVATRDPSGRRVVALAREWRGTTSRPLSPRAVLVEVAMLLAEYRLRSVITDQAAVDHLRDLAPCGLSLIEAPWTAQSKAEAYEHVLRLAQSERLELHPDPQLRADLLGIRKRYTRNGVTYELAEVDGRHSDYAPAVALAVDDARWPAREPEGDVPASELAARAKREFLESRRRERERAERQGRAPITHRRAS